MVYDKLYKIQGGLNPPACGVSGNQWKDGRRDRQACLQDRDLISFVRTFGPSAGGQGGVLPRMPGNG